MTARLAPSIAGIVQYVATQGGSDPVATVISPLLSAGKVWADAPDVVVDPAARTFFLMRLGSTVQANLRACEANIAFLNSKHPTQELVFEKETQDLLKNAGRYAAAFDEVFGPVLHRALIAVERTLDASFGGTTVTLEPGQLELGVGVTPSGGARTEIATYKVKTNGIEHLALLVAPTFTGCWTGCFDRFEQVAQPIGTGSHSVLDRSHRWYDVSVVAALHVTTYSWENWGLGALLGCPIGTSRDTSSNFVLGAGLRHSSGLELAVGVHAMLSRTLKSGYAMPLDLDAASNSNLTMESVTTDVPRVGVFVLVGFAPSVFTSINK